MAKKPVTDRPKTVQIKLPEPASPLARTDGSYSRSEFRQTRQQAAERAITKQTVRAARKRAGSDPTAAMTARQLARYEGLKKAAAALEQIANTPPKRQPVLTEDDIRFHKQHFKTATEQLARLFRRKSVGDGGKSDGAKARSH